MKKVGIGLCSFTIAMVIMLAFVGSAYASDPGEQPPAAPSNLTVTAAGPVITLTWTDNSENDLGFLVERGTERDGWMQVGNLTPNLKNFSDTLTTPGTYYYRVQAYNNYGTSDYTNIESYMLKIDYPDDYIYRPAAPSQLRDAGSGFDVNLLWKDNSDSELGFSVEKKSPGGVWSKIGVTGENITSFSDRIAAQETGYYRVMAFNNFGPSSYSNLISTVFNPDGSTGVPGNLRGTVSGAEVTLSWTMEGDNIAGFLVERRTPGGSWLQVGNINRDVKTFLETVADPGLYSYRIGAVSDMGTPVYSSEISVLLGSVAGKTISMQIGSPLMNVNGNSVEIDPGRETIPAIVAGRTLVPVRAIVEALGGTIAWDPNASKITIQDGATVVEYWIDSNVSAINGNRLKMDVAPMIINSRTLLPVRFVADSMGATVDWDEPTRRIIIRR